ncbi:MAG: FAD-binding oxidoreductase, partial [Anaerolineae bacterium]|nr:FAD-binding oxidoreductase [Anaerolineae bacterium]
MDEKKARLLDIVGEVGVVDHPEIGESFSLDHDLIPPLKPCLTVKPKDVDEVQKIVLWANETHTPLVPMSSGGPHFRGDTLATAPESVIVDLSGMKRILKVDRRNRLALVEPGVTYTQLQPELQREGLRIVMPLLPRSNKSVIASLLEREPVISPRYQWNLLEPLRSLEIVWGSGDKFYSGSGTFRGEKDEDWQEGKVPLQGPGPGQLDYYKFVSAAQGSMGIVTWASVKCEVFPEFRKLFFVPAEKLDDLLDFTYRLLKFRFGDELFIVNNTCLATILSDGPDEVEPLRDTLPAWTVVVGITGGHILPREKVEGQENDVRDIAQQFGLKMVPAVPGCRGGDFLELLLKPSAEPYWKLRTKGGAQEVFFLTTLDKTPGYVATMVLAASEHRYPVPDIGIYIQPVYQGVGCHCEFTLPFDRENEAEVT